MRDRRWRRVPEPPPSRTVTARNGGGSHGRRRSEAPVWPVLAVFLAVFAVALVATSAVLVTVARWCAVGAGGARADAQHFASSAAGIMTSAVVSDAVLLAAAFATAGYTRRHEPRDDPVRARLGLGRTRATVKDVRWATIGLLGLSFACGGVVEMTGWSRGSALAAIERALASPPTGGSPIELVWAIELVTLAIVPAIAEEVFFRGLMQIHIARGWGRWPAIVTASAAFGLYHLDAVQGTSAFCAGLFLGWVADRFGGVRIGVFAHAFNNATFLVLTAVRARTGSEIAPVHGSLGGSATVAAGVLACACAATSLRRGAVGTPSRPRPNGG